MDIGSFSSPGNIIPRRRFPSSFSAADKLDLNRSSREQVLLMPISYRPGIGT